jgi:hypothetical protein
MSLIISCLAVIPPNPQSNVNHHKEKLNILLLSNYRNRYLNLHNALKEKSFSDWYFFIRHPYGNLWNIDHKST